ncbi:hypothetical protein Zm00014a_009945 [Zea mays]|jgi:hypothetical protein|uniref:Uncharacterized protein n=2 Tax=Zea mays TaxID=4577 RepID=A0A1D6KRB2_MAIZE|nr:uncharacterized protein LOC100274947 [Zea mays]ONM05259.1 hypothetical protein ZEAMMB73_Zm00001d032522 [Zea mays]PWZ56394.1 hypothetical protein Zm00014a_009945 [Zea mays]|eukprot:XP_008664775.1 uncharacterized protein LOC100274947 [Zea mays]
MDDVYISEEYVARRHAERRAARIAAASCCGEETIKPRADSEQKRWSTEKGRKRPADGGNADTNVGGGGAACWLVGQQDAVLSYFSA